MTLALGFFTAYALGAVAGTLNEMVQKPDQFRSRSFKSLALTYGAANVYGWSTVAMTGFFKVCEDHNVHPAIMLGTIGPMLAVLECLMGRLSNWYNGYHTWKYPHKYCTACDGYISAVSSAYFMAFGFVFYFGCYRPLLSGLFSS